jgi:hypothetical protein
MKIKTIILRAGFAHFDKPETKEGKGYQVQRVTDSIQYTPGDILTRRDVESLCESNQWKVTVEKNTN